MLVNPDQETAPPPAGVAPRPLEEKLAAVWLALPKTLEVVVVTAAGETRHATGDRLPPHPALPGLEPPVERFFRQLG